MDFNQIVKNIGDFIGQRVNKSVNSPAGQGLFNGLNYFLGIPKPNLPTTQASPMPTAMPTTTPSPINNKPKTLEDVISQNWGQISGSQPKPTSQPTMMPSPTQIPTSPNRIDPYPTNDSTPDRNLLYPKLRTKEAVIQPAVFDSIMKFIKDDYQRRLAMSLAYQESTGGLSPVGDEGKSFGPYHIMPGNAPYSEYNWSNNITKDQAMDPEYATRFLLGVMNNQLKAGKKPHEQVLRWNANSGYQKDKGLVDKNGVPYTQNLGPRYDEDIPRFATMAAFLRGN